MSTTSDETETVQPVTLHPKVVYGLRSDVVGNVHFSADQEVIYPVEGVLAVHDYVNNTQKFLRLSGDTKPIRIIISPNKKLLAVLQLDYVKNERHIAIYDLVTLKQRRYISLPRSFENHDVVQFLFTHEAKSMVLLSSQPEELIYVIALDKEATVTEGCPTTISNRDLSTCLACHPHDSNIIMMGGNGIISLITKTDKGFNITNTIKGDFVISSLTFLANEIVLLGTNNNEIMLLDQFEQRIRTKASDLQEINLAFDEVQIKVKLPKEHQIHMNFFNKAVQHLIVFPRGFAYAIANNVIVFEKLGKYKYERKTILTIPITIYDEQSYQICNIAIDPKQETIVVTTKHSQIYIGILIVPETLKTKYLKFQTLGTILHIDEIVDMSVCSWKPIIMTASRDQTVRIWNYESNKMELVRKYQVHINIVELAATGLMAAIGFSDQLRIAQIFMEDLNVVKTYNFPRCKDVKFSNYGHIMAVAHDNLITLTSTYKLEVIRTLQGHNGNVLCLAFSNNDKYLVTAGSEGAIYQWEIETGARILEIVDKGTDYKALAVTLGDPLRIYAGTSDGVIRQFLNGELTREVSLPSKKTYEMTDLCLSRSDMIMFAANMNGELFNVQLPFMDAGGGQCYNYRFFSSPITKLIFTYDGTQLVVASKSGTLGIWALGNIDDRVVSLDKDLLKSNEILIPRYILDEKNEQINSLELRIRQQAEEYRYQLAQNELIDDQQLAQTHKTYCAALDELKKSNLEIVDKHEKEMNTFRLEMKETQQLHKQKLESMTNLYSERMLMEYNKFNNLRDSMLSLREYYENQLKSSAGELQVTVEGLETDYKRQLEERRELIRELMKEMQEKKIEFMEYCRQVEEENDRNTIDSQVKYQTNLTTYQNEAEYWRGRSRVFEKKYMTSCQDIDKLHEDLEQNVEQRLRTKAVLNKLTQNIEDLQKDVNERDHLITSKEKRIYELMQKNQELDKYKLVLAHKINELKLQIEPKDYQIMDKRKQIIELETELEGMNKSSLQLELQQRELKDKYYSVIAELNLEKKRSRASKECVNNISQGIYEVATKINQPTELALAVKDLFHKHASNDEVKRYMSTDTMVRDEFVRQRDNMEKVLAIYQKKLADKTQEKKNLKLLKENCFLIKEIDNLRDENNLMRKACQREIQAQQLAKRDRKLSNKPKELNDKTT